MSKHTAAEVELSIRKTQPPYGRDPWTSIFYEEGPETTKLGRITVVKNDGGGEGSAEYCPLIFSLHDLDGDVSYWRVEGSYNSWSGLEFDGELEEVFPTPVTQIEYLPSSEVSGA